jgi:subtilase family serine protease
MSELPNVFFKLHEQGFESTSVTDNLIDNSSALRTEFFKDVKPRSLPKMKRFLNMHKSAVVNTDIPPQYFSGSQLLNLYNVPTIKQTNKNIRQTRIAVIIAFTYPGLLQDLTTYWQNDINFGPSSKPPKVNVYTMQGATFNDGWAQEECLDVQMVCTINPNANIYVVEAKSDLSIDLMKAIDYAVNTLNVDVVSMSWGDLENNAYASYSKLFNNIYVTYCAASGDYNYASWPSVLQNCISVGGTTLLWTPNGKQTRTEYSWNKSGCGYSSSIPQPNYQKNISGITHTHRAIPDVSLVANEQTCVYTVYKGKWYGIGGTSVATPIFAAMVSLANQMRFNLSKNPLTSVYSLTNVASNNYKPLSNNIQHYLYTTLYNNKAEYQNVFYDVIIGSNEGSIAGTNRGLTTYNSTSGYDITTGLGSPKCTNFCTSLAKL